MRALLIDHDTTRAAQLVALLSKYAFDIVGDTDIAGAYAYILTHQRFDLVVCPRTTQEEGSGISAENTVEFISKMRALMPRDRLIVYSDDVHIVPQKR